MKRVHKDKGRGDRSRMGRIVLPTVLSATAVTAVPAAAADEAADSIEEIVVSASRVSRAGFEAPTPVTVLSERDFKNVGATSVASYLNELPAFQASATPTSTTSSTNLAGVQYLNLRGLGANRTLVMLNSRRHMPTTSDGSVDLNLIPSAVIERVEVVTGGASAAWGSDAVAGVVNLILKQDFEGLEVEAQYGVSDESDNETTNFSAVFGGAIADGRGHVLLAAEHFESDGVANMSDRAWGREGWGVIANPEDTGPNDGIPAQLVRPNMRMMLGTEGGAVLGDPGVGAIQFGPGGTVQPYEFGSIVSSPFMVGGDGHFWAGDSGISVPVERDAFLATINYDITDDLRVFFEGSYGSAHTVSEVVQGFSWPAQILSGNPFIPESVQAGLDDAGAAGFGLFRFNTDIGEVVSDIKSRTYRSVVGLEGSLSDTWSWEFYYQRGQMDKDYLLRNNPIPANLVLATDAVTDPGSGAPACRAALAGTAPDCAPINLFGFGSPSAEAIAYVTGTAFAVMDQSEDVLALELAGSVFDLPSGPVLVALGLEYREESFESRSDRLSQQDAFFLGNVKPLAGSFDVKEVFGEAAVPITDGLEFNAAGRYSDYSTAGSVGTWKLGLTYQPMDALRFRGSVSRDIRAPNIAELYTSESLSFANVFDPLTGNLGLSQVITSGNLGLSEETAETFTAGFSYAPPWLDGFRISVDWYDIELEDGIDTLAPNAVASGCADGVTALCDLIVRDPVTDLITRVHTPSFNLAADKISGVDFEMSWQRSLDIGDLQFRVIGSHVAEKAQSADGVQFIDRAGETGQLRSGGIPDWRWNAQLQYDRERLSLFAQVRYIGDGVYDATYTHEDIDDNHIESMAYLDLSGRYSFSVGRESELEVFAGLRNALDEDPPVAPRSDFIQQFSTNPEYYDVIGRFFYGGLRYRF